MIKYIEWKFGLGMLILFLLTGYAHSQDSLADPLKPFKPLLGKTWKGIFVNSTPEKPMYDISRWERALNGQAVRIIHSVNDGEYGGETILFWDSDKKELVYYYFTTAGFHTNGTMTLEAGKFISHEYVTGNQNGITEVKSTGEMLENRKLRAKSKYLKNGAWIDGHEIEYVEDNSAEVIFK